MEYRDDTSAFDMRPAPEMDEDLKAKLEARFKGGRRGRIMFIEGPITVRGGDPKAEVKPKKVAY